MTLGPYQERTRDIIHYLLSEYVFPALLACWALGVWVYILVLA